jgi:cellulose synthase/poly-beta-1,6-N-acetylglucosamine synthase-like glycosyltransferase
MIISTVIPLYNMAQYVGRAISSVLNQTCPPDEVIVVDDGSTDEGAKLVQNMTDPRIHYIYQENQGVSAARNLGITEAQGELIAFLDADDWWKPRFLEEIHTLRQQFPQAGAYATGVEYERLSGIISPEICCLLLPGGEQNGLLNFFKAIKYTTAWSSAMVVPKRILEEIGGFPEGEFISEDLDTWLRIALRYPIAWSGEPLATMHQIDSLEKNSKRYTKITQEPKLFQTAREAIAAGQVAPQDLPYLQESMAILLLALAGFLLMHGKKGLAQSFIESAIREFQPASAGKRLRFATALPFNLFPETILRVWLKVILYFYYH